MSRYRAVAVCDRDGFGLPLKVEVAGRLPVSVPILGPDGELLGECTSDSFCFWDPRSSFHGPRVADIETRKALASTGKLRASVDEKGRVVALRVESRGLPPSRARAERYPRLDELEYFERPASILSVGGRPVRRD